ncbi:MAG: methyltransferase domain-containing protein [Chloroflexota bacterium]
MNELNVIETTELLPVALLDQHRPLVEDLKRLARSLRLEFGWHYLLDLSWILGRLKPGGLGGMRILEAGAGTGILQWYLAEQGAEVFSVDRMSRAALPLRFRRRFNVAGLRSSDLLPAGSAFWQGFNRPIHGGLPRRAAATLAAQARDLAGYFSAAPAAGQVWVYNQDLGRMDDIPDGSLDAVVSVSALEHNTPEGLESVVQEIMRKLKPGGLLLATLTAGKGQDSWHTPSAGWCYTDVTLRRLFHLPDSAATNYDRYDELFAQLRECAELRDNLAGFYRDANNKGMPGGVWDPQYQPVGVCKIKPIA